MRSEWLWQRPKRRLCSRPTGEACTAKPSRKISHACRSRLGIRTSPDGVEHQCRSPRPFLRILQMQWKREGCSHGGTLPERLSRGHDTICRSSEQRQEFATMEGESPRTWHTQRGRFSVQDSSGCMAVYGSSFLVPFPTGRCHRSRPQQPRLIQHLTKLGFRSGPANSRVTFRLNILRLPPPQYMDRHIHIHQQVSTATSRLRSSRSTLGGQNLGNLYAMVGGLRYPFMVILVGIALMFMVEVLSSLYTTMYTVKSGVAYAAQGASMEGFGVLGV